MVYEKNLVAALSHSPFIKVTLDTGHFTAFGGDAVAFAGQYHDRVANLYLKDRLRRAEDRNDENTTEWGKGDAPIADVLRLMRDQKYTFPACIEYEYAGKGTAVEEVQRCLDCEGGVDVRHAVRPFLLRCATGDYTTLKAYSCPDMWLRAHCSRH